MFKTFSSLALFHGIICQNVHSLKECTWLFFFPPSCWCSWWCWVRPAQSCSHNFLPTCSPCSRIFVLPLGGCTAGWVAAARQQNSTLQRASRLLAVAWLQTVLPCYWLRVCRVARTLAKRGEKHCFYWVLGSGRLLRLVWFDGSRSLETRPV